MQNAKWSKQGLSVCLVGENGEIFCIGKRAPWEGARSSMQNFLGILEN